MPDGKDLPFILKTAAYLCFFHAVWIALDSFVVFRQFFLDPLGLLFTAIWIAINVLTGLGLLNLEPNWRTFALGICWVSFILCPIFLLLPLSATGPAFYYEKFKNLFDLAAAIWTYRVLTRSHIRQLFAV